MLPSARNREDLGSVFLFHHVGIECSPRDSNPHLTGFRPAASAVGLCEQNSARERTRTSTGCYPTATSNQRAYQLRHPCIVRHRGVEPLIRAAYRTAACNRPA